MQSRTILFIIIMLLIGEQMFQGWEIHQLRQENIIIKKTLNVILDVMEHGQSGKLSY